MHKVGITLLLTGWLREKKHDKFYLRGRACIESVRGSFEFELSLPFLLVCRFSYQLLVL
jgi:hypothetical protein